MRLKYIINILDGTPCQATPEEGAIAYILNTLRTKSVYNALKHCIDSWAILKTSFSIGSAQRYGIIYAIGLIVDDSSITKKRMLQYLSLEHVSAIRPPESVNTNIEPLDISNPLGEKLFDNRYKDNSLSGTDIKIIFSLNTRTIKTLRSLDLENIVYRKLKKNKTTINTIFRLVAFSQSFFRENNIRTIRNKELLLNDMPSVDGYVNIDIKDTQAVYSQDFARPKQLVTLLAFYLRERQDSELKDDMRRAIMDHPHYSSLSSLINNVVGLQK